MKPSLTTLILALLLFIGTFISIQFKMPCIAFFCPFIALLLALIGIQLHRENN